MLVTYFNELILYAWRTLPMQIVTVFFFTSQLAKKVPVPSAWSRIPQLHLVMAKQNNT